MDENEYYHLTDPIRRRILHLLISRQLAIQRMMAAGIDPENAVALVGMWEWERDLRHRIITADVQQKDTDDTPCQTEQDKIDAIHRWFVNFDVSPGQALWRLSHTSVSYTRARKLIAEWTREREHNATGS